MKKVVFVTNIPAPYRERTHEILFNKLQSYWVIYCAAVEPNRNWNFKYGHYAKIFLKERTIKYKKRTIHINFDIISVLNRINPDIVITTGFNPSFLLAFLWAKAKKKKHICMTDAWSGSEKNLSSIHKAVRKFIYKSSDSFIGASQKSMELYTSYGCHKNAIFYSPLCADFKPVKTPPKNKKFNIMFAGQFIERKLPLFFCDIAWNIKQMSGSCSALIIGDGPMKNIFLNRLEKYGIDFYYAGFIQQQELPKYYSKAKIFLFPTLNDPWGIVVNEACAAGLPIITCNNAGCSDELVQNNANGYILPLKAEIWAKKVTQLLSDPDLYKYFSENSLKIIKHYNHANAAEGIKDAILFVMAKDKSNLSS